MESARVAILAVFWIALATSVLSGEPITIRWMAAGSGSRNAVAYVYGLPPESLRRATNYDRVLTVHAGQRIPLAADLPSMSGIYTVETNALRFEPQFPLEPGVSYTAVVHPGELGGSAELAGETLRASFRLPDHRENPTTIVNKVCPTAEVLPENLLKFYVHFSAPMSRGQIYEHIHLRNEKGSDVELPFLEIDEELWDPSMTRLTLLLDPGRIKRGVRPLEEVGPALEAGKKYTLIIDKTWKDGAGDPLKESFQKRFRVGPPDRTAPNPKGWKIRGPRTGTVEALAIHFGKPMDEALSQRTIRVRTTSGQMIGGKVDLRDHERTWMFTPDGAWISGSYKISVGTTIEDLAGNNIGKPFDLDLFEKVDHDLSSPTVELPFTIR